MRWRTRLGLPVDAGEFAVQDWVDHSPSDRGFVEWRALNHSPQEMDMTWRLVKKKGQADMRYFYSLRLPSH